MKQNLIINIGMYVILNYYTFVYSSSYTFLILTTHFLYVSFYFFNTSQDFLFIMYFFCIYLTLCTINTITPNLSLCTCISHPLVRQPLYYIYIPFSKLQSLLFAYARYNICVFIRHPIYFLYTIL